MRFLRIPYCPLNDGGVLRGPALYARGLQRVHRAEHQRVVGRHDREVHALFHGETHQPVDILRADRHAHRVRRNAAVAGQRIQFRDSAVFL